jgi:hypothetical protein
MKNKIQILCAIILLTVPYRGRAQGTAFTYQGVLSTPTGPANGSYDFTFALFNAGTAGTQLGSTLSTPAIGITNGQFTVTLDFGSGIFTGNALWLQISARTNGAPTFTTLTPRQAILPAPYAIFANTASNLSGTLAAGQITGTVADSQLSANIPRLNSSPTFSGTVTAGGFSGNGSGLAALNASQLTSGALPNAQLSGTYLSPVTINNSADVFSGGGLTIATNRAGGWQNSIVKLSNTGTGPNNAPALRVVNDGGTNNDGALSVSVNVPPGAANGIIAEFGNANVYVVTITNDGTIYANGFVGNGSVPWQVVNGTSVQAGPDTGYLLTSAQLTTLTLPPSPSVGDIVRISGGGAGGWKVAQNGGQSILATTFTDSVGVNWPLSPDSPTAYFLGVACSSDGTKAAAIVNNGLIYISSDSGVTWSSHGSSQSWTGIASSSDGTKLAATTFGQIYVSIDSGLNWSPHGPNTNWSGVASSADGTRTAAAAFNSIWTSSNSGTTWTMSVNAPAASYQCIACSADGTKLVAGSSTFLYTSPDSGATWTQRGSNLSWQAVASSADGTRLVAAVPFGQIWTSSDSGVTWTAHATSQDGHYWDSVCSSADGTRLAACAEGFQVCVSVDAGATWAVRGPSVNWIGVACSADGTRFVGVTDGSSGRAYTSQPAYQSTTTAGTGGYLVGAQGSAIELQFIGSGQFKPLSQEGTILGY